MSKRFLASVRRHSTRAQPLQATGSAIRALAEEQADRFSRLIDLSQPDQPIGLITNNNVACAATVKALSDLQVSAVLLPSPGLIPLAQAHAGIRSVVSVDASTGELNRDMLSSSSSSCPRSWMSDFGALTGENGACVMATSGSGQAGPKLVIYRWTALQNQAEYTDRRIIADACRITESTEVRFVAASNIGHAYNNNGLFTGLLGDGDVGFAGCAEDLVQILLANPSSKSSRATIVFATPRVYEAFASQPEGTLGHVRGAMASRGETLFMYSAGCPLPPHVKRSIHTSLGVRVLQNYGSTETGNICLQDLWAENENVGQCWGTVELRVPGDGRLLPQNALGEICTTSPWISDGYLREGQLQRHPDFPWVSTGDAGRWEDEAEEASDSGDSGRQLVVLDRLRPPIRVDRGGWRVQVQPYEVEASLKRLGASTAAALQGTDGQLWVAIQKQTGKALDYSQLPLQPDRVVERAELPVSPAGKVLHSKIRELFDE